MELFRLLIESSLE